MRVLPIAALLIACVVGFASGESPQKDAPKVVLKSADGQREVDLAKLFQQGPVLVRLTCACSGCDKELPQFQKLQAAYASKGLQTVAIFREKSETAAFYANNMALKFPWVADPKGETWKVFGATAMPTNILIEKGGRVVKVVPGCTPDGTNARTISAEVAKLLKTEEVKVGEIPAKK